MGKAPTVVSTLLSIGNIHVRLFNSVCSAELGLSEHYC